MQYRSIADINIYDSPNLERLATQMAKERYLRFIESESCLEAKYIQLIEDGYTGYLDPSDWQNLQPAGIGGYQPIYLTAVQIRERIDLAIAYTKTAMQQQNEYLWGGTVPPNYDCSGLMQAAFASVGVWIPRDAYQQEAFAQPIVMSDLQPGDLIFFGLPQQCRATHVGMYLGNGQYIHSSGKDGGRNGIGIDSLAVEPLEANSQQLELSRELDRDNAVVSRRYAAQLRGAGRINKCYGGVFENIEITYGE